MLRSSLLLLVALCALAVPVRSQSNVDPAFFNGLRYRLVGPSRGGRVTTVTGVPSQPKTFYMGVASGGLFRTTDSGATWTPITDGKVPLGSTGSCRRCRFRSKRHLSRHRLRRRAQQRLHRPRHVQVNRRRTDVEVHRSLQRRPDRRGAHSSDESRHRLGRRPAATSSKQTTSAAFSKPLTAARRGAKFCSSPTASARWTSSCNRAIRTSFTRGCRGSSASRGRSSAARAKAVSTRAPTAANTSRRSRTGFPTN